MTLSARALPDARKNQIVIGVLIAMFLAALDQTIVSPALPTIGAALGDESFLPWVASAYLLTGTAVTPLYGKFSDIHGRRPALILALGIFLAGSTFCALAPSMLTLILGRLLQGVGGGGLTAIAQAVIADVASPRERARYTAHISTVWASASVAGPVLGGFFAQHLSWTVIFWINLPIGGVALVVCDRILRDLPQVRRPHRLDLIGSALMIGSSLTLMLMLTLGGVHYPWSSAPVFALAAAGVALAALLFRHLARDPEPLLPLGIFANRVVGRAMATLFLAMFAYVGSAIYLPLFFETELGLDATASGAGLIVLLGGTVVGSTIAGRGLPRVRRYKSMSYVGLCLSLGALAGMAAFSSRLGFVGIEVLLLFLGAGLGTIFPTLNVCVQNAVEPADLGIATATIVFVRSFGAAVGVAIVGALIFAFGLEPDAAAPGASEAAPEAFRAAFALMTLALAGALACFSTMEERPLRGPATETPAVE